jgi:hypothetical protein|uniref:Uncharacterized protein n=1 Tax=viral metagenome TaxID=1070528 RepID=A0A6C0ITB4_9ZZZZ
MSQSDYLRRKRISNILYNDISDNPIYNSKTLLDFKQYQLENEIVSLNINNQKMGSAESQRIFNMDRNVTNCPTFIVCTNTSLRPNRVAHAGRMCNDLPLNWRDKNDLHNAKEPWCKCQLNRSTTDDNKACCSVCK